MFVCIFILFLFNKFFTVTVSSNLNQNNADILQSIIVILQKQPNWEATVIVWSYCLCYLWTFYYQQYVMLNQSSPQTILSILLSHHPISPLCNLVYFSQHRQARHQVFHPIHKLEIPMLWSLPLQSVYRFVVYLGWVYLGIWSMDQNQ